MATIATIIPFINIYNTYIYNHYELWLNNGFKNGLIVVIGFTMG